MERVLITLTPSEAKRLIGKAVAMMEPVRESLKKGTIVICLGTTNAYVAEEILGRRMKERGMFSIGVITPEGTCVSDSDRRSKEIVISKGKLMNLGLKDVIKELGPSDVFIKGANALDPWGNAGVYLGSKTGGTMGMSIGVILARGVKVIIPVSLEKFIPYSVADLVPRLGNEKFLFSMNLPVGMMPILGEIVTEIEAMNTLFGCECLPIGGSGINGGEGSRCYLIEGDKRSVNDAWKGVMKIKGELPLTVKLEDCRKCKMECKRGMKSVA
jgi:hypothetical protein